MKILSTILSLAAASMLGLHSLYAEEPPPVYTSLASDQASLSPEEQAAINRQAQAELVCAPIADAAAKAEAFGLLSAMKWDRKKMGCGAQYGYELAQANPQDVEFQLRALGVQVDYFAVLDKNYSRLYSSSPMKDRELSLRWQTTRERSQALIERLQTMSKKVPEVVALHGIYILASATQETSDKEAFAAPGRAIPHLEAAVEQKPEALDGAALLVLGQVLLQLPEFAGGDIDRAIALLEQGGKLAPANVAVKVALIDACIAERRNDEALVTLKEAADIPAQGQNEQDYADSLRTLAGQAVRLGQQLLAREIASRREHFLDAHPYLDRRKSTASAGHGGVDPITGEDTDKI